MSKIFNLSSELSLDDNQSLKLLVRSLDDNCRDDTIYSKSIPTLLLYDNTGLLL